MRDGNVAFREVELYGWVNITNGKYYGQTRSK